VREAARKIQLSFRPPFNDENPHGHEAFQNSGLTIPSSRTARAGYRVDPENAECKTEGAKSAQASSMTAQTAVGPHRIAKMRACFAMVSAIARSRAR
jgi:hypothetical protein